MLKRLRFKFILINMAIVSVMICVILSIVLHTTQINLESESLRTLQSIADSPNEISPFGKPGEDSSGVRLPYFLLYLDGKRITILGGGDYFDLSDEDMLNDIVQTVTEAEADTGILEKYELRYYHTSTALGDGFVFADAGAELSTLESLEDTCILIGAASFLIFLLLSCLLARWAVKPVEAAWRQQTQFVSDASHELKTPLTVIMTNAELLQSPEYDEQAKRQFSRSILTMSQQMRGLVEDMLNLARVEKSRQGADTVPLNISKLVADALLPFEPVFFEKGLTLSCGLTADLTVRGNAPQLRQVVEILLDNAQKYAAPGGSTLVALRRNGYSHVLLSVSNQGAPISDEDLPHLFERFYRTDKARSMDQSYGLGLSIAQSIVRRHHGRIWAQSSGGYNTFFVELPI